MTWWDRDTHADRRPILMARNRIQAALRAWFTDQGFTEVDPAYLVTSPGNETHLHPVRVEVMDTALTPRRGYLHTSPNSR
jgi:lysyl-tRNA synthetase class 2